MKKLLLNLVVIALSSTMLSAGNKIPEYDGGYIEPTKGNLIEIEETPMYKNKIYNFTWGNEYFHDDYVYFALNKKNMQTISKNNFKQIVIKGDYSFKDISFHHLKTIKLTKGERLFSDNTPRPRIFHKAGEKIKIRKKQINNNTYSFIARDKLKKGEYIAWIGSVFWLFKIK